MKRHMFRRLCSMGSIVAVSGLAALAEDPPAGVADGRKLEVSAFVDGYYSYNTNQPADHENFFPGVGTSAKRDGEIALNLAQVDIVLAPQPVGFHLALGFGQSTDVVHAAELDPDKWAHVVQASIQYQTKIGRGLLFEGGIYPSHIGMETLATKDNWNYTHSWLGELSPYYQTGVKAAYPFSEHWSGQFHVLNGWQMIDDVNDSMSYGAQLAYAGDKLTWSLNGIVGPELPDNNHDQRSLLDTVLVWKATPSFSFGTSVDVASQDAPDDDASWYGIGLYGRWAPPDARSAIALRTEYYDDGDGAISGTAQTLKEITATFEFRPVEPLILKLEARYDKSTAPVFAGENLDTDGAVIRDETDQLLFVVGVVAKF